MFVGLHWRHIPVPLSPEAHLPHLEEPTHRGPREFLFGTVFLCARSAAIRSTVHVIPRLPRRTPRPRSSPSCAAHGDSPLFRPGALVCSSDTAYLPSCQNMSRFNFLAQRRVCSGLHNQETRPARPSHFSFSHPRALPDSSTTVSSPASVSLAACSLIVGINGSPGVPLPGHTALTPDKSQPPCTALHSASLYRSTLDVRLTSLPFEETARGYGRFSSRARAMHRCCSAW